mgnify:CR=1 FL=1
MVATVPYSEVLISERTPVPLKEVAVEINVSPTEGEADAPIEVKLVVPRETIVYFAPLISVCVLVMFGLTVAVEMTFVEEGYPFTISLICTNKGTFS